MGMIQLFDVITLYGTADPKLLAGGISLALITTEAGLIVAIPVHLLHNWLEGKSTKLLAKMDTVALELLNSAYTL
jgi:biopolymer transport protein ExbB